MKKNIKKALFILAGLTSLSIAAVVRFVPGVPVTPFVLFALFCFNKSSERLSNWLVQTRLYQKYLANLVKHKAMTAPQKLSIQIFATTMMTLSFIAVDNIFFRGAMIFAAFAHNYVFVFRIKTLVIETAAPKNPSVIDRFYRRFSRGGVVLAEKIG